MTDRIEYEEPETTPLQRVRKALELARNVLPMTGARHTIESVLEKDMRAVDREYAGMMLEIAALRATVNELQGEINTRQGE